MPDAIIAVGGTGKRAALLYLKLVNTLQPAGIVNPGTNVFVVDMEPEPNTIDYSLNEQLQIEGVPAAQFISPVPQVARINGNITLSRFMGFDEPGADAVARTCFNSNQLNVQVIQGMNCEPTVGAAVGARRFASHLADDEVVGFGTRLASCPRIIVVGSIIGGTGAGVIPELVKWVRNRFPTTPIYGLLFLQWIDIPTVRENEPSNVKIAGNTKAWLNYLMEHHPQNNYGVRSKLFDHYVLLGVPDRIPKNSAIDPNHHPVHLLGALYLLQFDQFLQKAPGASGPHFIELGDGVSPDTIQVGDDNMRGAVIRERLFVRLLAEFAEQRPDYALSSFTLFLSGTYSWKPFINTLRNLDVRWNRGNFLSDDWNDIREIFRQSRQVAENRISELQQLTDNLPGARQIFAFKWNALTQATERAFATARTEVINGLREESAEYDSHPQAVIGVANNFIQQLRSILRNTNIN